MAIPESDSSAPAVQRVCVHKFGGSSVADAAGFRRVAMIVREHATSRPCVVVVSAVAGVTDRLVALAADAVAGCDWRAGVEELRELHCALARELLGGDAAPAVAHVETRCRSLSRHLDALSVVAVASEAALAPVHGCGELLSSQLLCALLHTQGGNAAWLDACEVLVVEPGELGKRVDWQASGNNLALWRAQHAAPLLVAPGFVARDGNGQMTTLGRNGSDFSAAILARLFNAAELSLWGDTDGVLSADPRLVPDAVSVPALSYDEACELAYFGARVIHPQTLAPAMAAGMPLRIRGFRTPDANGTRIGARADGAPVKGLSAMRDLALVTIEGAGMLGVPGTAERVFAALRQAGVSVVMISQGSSEHSICCVVRAAECALAEKVLARAFALELAEGSLHAVRGATGIAVLAAVGDGMAGTPGTAARLFAALARAGINIRAIAQGASERNISLAVAEADVQRALRAAHTAFWLSPQTVSIGLIGAGRVGRALLAQLAASRGRLIREAGLDLRVRAVAGSRRMWLGEAGEAPDAIDERANHDCDLDVLARHVQAEHLPHALVIDCTAADGIADRYPDWLARGIHVVTPNKHAGAGDLNRWRSIRGAMQRSHWRYEATVGAGLPIMQTLRDLLDTGDELLAIDGVLSGSLAWLFNAFDGGRPFSQLVAEAQQRGYTEPDPREDLSGMDVARKLVILAREAGRELSLADVEIENLVPPALADLPLDALLPALTAIDGDMAARLKQARAKDCVLRHVAQLDREGHARVGVLAVPRTHAFAGLRLTDNCVQFTTARYCDNPLVVQGPGAGPEVTAAGVFADVLRIAAQLGNGL